VQFASAAGATWLTILLGVLFLIFFLVIFFFFFSFFFASSSSSLSSSPSSSSSSCFSCIAIVLVVADGFVVSRWRLLGWQLDDEEVEKGMPERELCTQPCRFHRSRVGDRRSHHGRSRHFSTLKEEGRLALLVVGCPQRTSGLQILTLL
jgi:hypothetical protein